MTPAERDADRLRLLALLADLSESGRRIPCMDGTVADVSGFTSEDEAEQQRAARLCVGCAGATTCGQYGTTYPKEFGVYGGATNSERQPKRGRPAKTSKRGAAA